MDKRLKKIASRLSEYSLGKFDKGLTLSSELDEVDAIINGINMLGEELKAITISRNYFTNIFNSVSDMVFILNARGVIEDLNASAEVQLQYSPGYLKGTLIRELYRDQLSFRNITRELKTRSRVTTNSTLYTMTGVMIPVHVTITYFRDAPKKQLLLLTATDITFQVKTENLIIRAIIDTQEKERRRLAKDLHDSLTQQLSAIKFYISGTINMARNKKHKTILVKSSEALTEVISDMRNICFSLMPKTLEEFGLVKAVRESFNHSLYKEKVRFDINGNDQLPELLPELSIDLYRVIQEFINNAIKHGRADAIAVRFGYSKDKLTIKLSDNGQGFDSSRVPMGMGLQNVQSRIQSHHGLLNVVSIPGKGTRYTITIPLNSGVSP